MKLVDSSITATFKCVFKAKVTYSHHQHTTGQQQLKLSKQSLSSIFHCINPCSSPVWKLFNRSQRVKGPSKAMIMDSSLMKMGRPGYHIPSAKTVSHDVKKVFTNVRKHVARILPVIVVLSCSYDLQATTQKYNGNLNFATDTWTSPNHKAYIAFMVHFEQDGDPISMLLDLVEVAKSHSRVNLVEAFAKVLEEFGIKDKVSYLTLQMRIYLPLVFQLLSITCDNASNNDKMIERLSILVENFPGPANQTRCFMHILNLVAKSILHQFDMAKKLEGDPDNSDDAMRELTALAQELDLGPNGNNDDGDDGVDDDNDDDDDDGGGDGEELGDKDGGMSEEEAIVLEKSPVPIPLTLTKVC